MEKSLDEGMDRDTFRLFYVIWQVWYFGCEIPIWVAMIYSFYTERKKMYMNHF